MRNGLSEAFYGGYIDIKWQGAPFKQSIPSLLSQCHVLVSLLGKCPLMSLCRLFFFLFPLISSLLIGNSSLEFQYALLSPHSYTCSTSCIRT